MNTLEIIGRSSSLFTRMARIFAEELCVPYRLVPVPDMTALATEVYGGNPARKLPVLRTSEWTLFGAQNICRELAHRAGKHSRILWPEDLHDPLVCNAQELASHGMAAQVQLAFGVVICKLPAKNIYFVKTREGLEGTLAWLDEHLANVRRQFPTPRDLSLFEVSLFCLIDHLTFRPTVSITPYQELLRFAEEFGNRACARNTPYRFDS